MALKKLQKLSLRTNYAIFNILINFFMWEKGVRNLLL